MRISRHTFLRHLSLCVIGARKVVHALSNTVRWGMAVEIAKCAKDSGCIKCIVACHRAHNVPAIPDRRHEIRWLGSESFEHAFGPQDPYAGKSDLPVMIMCNHCDNPPCVRVCPVQATWKRGDGIVMMDWHRCIGCRYCMAACPYGSRSFNWEDPRRYLHNPNPDFPTRTKGVVEKCNMCEERLAAGRPPACVESCPEKALTFGNLADSNSDIRAVLRSRRHIRRKPQLGTGPNVFYIV